MTEETKPMPESSLEAEIPDTIYVWRHGDDEPINGMFLDRDDTTNPGRKYVSAQPQGETVEALHLASCALIKAKHRLAEISEGSAENFPVYGECLKAIEAIKSALAKVGYKG